MHVIVGGDSLIGKSLAKRLFNRKISYISSTRRQNSNNEIFIDLSKPETFSKIPEGATVVYILAAVSSIKECEDNWSSTFKINVTNTCKLVKHVSEFGCKVVFVSTNQVFNGFAPFQLAGRDINPQNPYAKQKNRVEKYLCQFPNVSILRLGKVVETLEPLIMSWIHNLSRNQVVEPFFDLNCSPVKASDASDMLIGLAESGKNGFYALTGDEDFSYERIALYLAKKMNKTNKISYKQ